MTLKSLIICIVLSWNFFTSNAFTFTNRVRRKAENVSCILPQHPENGEWSLFNGNGTPGQKVSPASIIKFQCHHGYKLSTENALSVCTDQWTPPKFPECEMLCPPLYPSNTYELNCVNKLGREIECAEATDGTTLEYTCSDFYETPFGYKKTLFCKDGHWSHPKPVCRPVCGKKNVYDKKPLIYGSKPEKERVYPWVIAIYQKFDDSYEQICGGSILSQTIVLTAAHCVTNEFGNVLPVKQYKVGAGKLYRTYQSAEDDQAQYRDLRKIVVPDEYKGNIRHYAADIAVLVLKEEFELTQVVRPVCFTNMNTIQLHAGHKGEVAGWGLTEGDKPSEVLRSLEIPYKYDTVCADELPAEFGDKYNLKDKICAGFVNQSTSVCKGDSGGGLVFQYREDTRYYIHGVVSLAPKEGFLCDIQQNSLYTRVASYYDLVEGLLTKYAPEDKDCILPPHPENGKWTSDISDSEPGRAVPSSTILTVKCDEGYRASSSEVKIECSSAYRMPKCEKLCPALNFPEVKNHYCTNRDGQNINCLEAIDGSVVWYTCPDHLQSVNGEESRTCVEGSWGDPTPECITPTTECGNVFSNGTDQEHPWTTAVYKFNRKSKKYTYSCGGTLISKRIVITAAKCVTVKDKNTYKIRTVLPHDTFSVAAGKIYSNYNDSRDQHAQFTKVSQIIVHPRFMLYRGFDSDIALLVAETPFTLNTFVQPACIAKTYDQDWRLRKIGTISGWRNEGGALTDKIHALELRIVTQLPCSGYERAEFYIRHDKICLEFVNESIVTDPSDNGKGFVLKNPKDEKYYIQAVDTGGELYNVNSFTDVGLHNEFINFILHRVGLY